MHPSIHAQQSPNKAALIIASSSETVSYQQLEQASNQAAHLFRKLKLKRGDVIAMMLENRAANLEIAWAAQRTGLYLTCISTKLSQEDFAYIVNDCGAKALITSPQLVEKYHHAISALNALTCYSLDRPTPFSKHWQSACAELPITPVADESHGNDMLYSSGTTGRPKGVKPTLIDGPIDQTNGLVEMGKALYQMDANSVFYSPAPLYHAAPLRWCMAVQKLGGTIVISDKFDEQQALAIIEQYQVTHAQWVPTHFYRLLNLPSSIRAKYNHASLVAVFHAAAPCPPNIKQAMIDWWGPIVHEYYSGTECPGITAISASEWLQKPGSVGKAILGKVRVCDEQGEELSPGSTGVIYFSDGPTFEYHHDPEKTQKSRNQYGWATLGDVGYLDNDGFLFLTDRKDFMIISGGVNIYPQEVENCLMEHPEVLDVAVFGLPAEEMGEQVVAVVQASKPTLADKANIDGQAALMEDLTAYCHKKIGKIKSPKQIFFSSSIPRLPTGKIQKKLLRELYLHG